MLRRVPLYFVFGKACVGNSPENCGEIQIASGRGRVVSSDFFVIKILGRDLGTNAVVTMVRDDGFFLDHWVRYYGGLFGRENCYVVSHGRDAVVEEIAQGCNIIGIPDDISSDFEVKRWGLLNALVDGLRRYHRHVIVADVDELVVLDPAAGLTLSDYLDDLPQKQVLTPVGLEVIHRLDQESETITDNIIGPRRFVRPAPRHSKPCIVSTETRIARGGHFAKSKALIAPEHLYLFHLKFCDFGVYCETLDKRNAMTRSLNVQISDTSIGRHWFPKARKEDRAVFDAFAELELREEFDLTAVRQHMFDTFGPRGNTGFYKFDFPKYQTQFRLPDRFCGVV